MGGSFPLNACIYDRYRRHGHMAALWTRGIPGHPAIRRQVVKYINPKRKLRVRFSLFSMGPIEKKAIVFVRHSSIWVSCTNVSHVVWDRSGVISLWFFRLIIGMATGEIAARKISSSYVQTATLKQKRLEITRGSLAGARPSMTSWCRRVRSPR